MEPKTFKIVLLIDTREKRTATDREFLQQGFKRNEVAAETRCLAVGDFVWIARSDSGEEVVLSHIVERKRIDDLASSIIDGRFKEQKVCFAYSVVLFVC